MSVPSARDERAPHRGTISVSFDNFGEAADLELGRHPQDEPIGRHFTACESFDALLGIVGDRPITYFVEASNALLYPDALRAMRDHGIEIGLHGWRHEHWGRLEPSRRPEVLARGVDALQGIGIRPRGFRPPGGEMREGALAEIARAGLDYCSPLGDAGAAGVSDGVPVLPFAWRHVDAYQLDPRLDALRARHGDPPQAADVAAWRATLDAAVGLAAGGGHVTVVLHPFLFLRDAAMRDALLALFARIDATPEVEMVGCATAAERIRGRAAAAGPR